MTDRSNQCPGVENLLPCPERPLDSDCCGNGCVPCVFDLYEEELKVWEAECHRLKYGEETDSSLQSESEEIKLCVNEYRSFPISGVSKESEDAVRIRCCLAPQQSLGLNIGQHIVIRAQTQTGSTVTRQYTPISPVDVKGYFDLVIKIYPGGKMSEVAKSWKVRDKLEARGPIGSLVYRRNSFTRILMLCAGTGVAPMCQVIASILADDLEDTYLRLVYCCRSYKQLIAKSDIDEWAKFWNFSVLYTLSQEPDPAPQAYRYGETIIRGRLSRDRICRELGSELSSTLVLVCGTPTFEADVIQQLKELGVQDANLHKF